MNDASTKLKGLAAELRKSLQQEQPDQETLNLLESLESDLHQVIEDNRADNLSSLLAELESRFAVNHPVAERYLRDIINTLGKMGI